MRHFLAFTILATSLSGFSVTHGEDSLFSEVAMESVFAKTVNTTKDVATKSDVQSIGRITGVSTLVQTLEAAGLEPKKKDKRVTLQFEHAGWKFPVSFEVQIERDAIILEFALIEISKETSLDQQVLLSLLSAGDASGGAFFAYDQANQMLVLRASIDNRAVTTDQIKVDLNRLANLAESESERWLSLKPRKSDTTKASNPTKETNSLVGRWSASIGTTQAFAIQFDAKNQFQLVHLKSGKSTVSRGKVTRSGSVLTLAGDDGTKLNCTITWQSGSQFQLAINDSKGKASLKLNFKKQK